jgi:hypothetical protein
VFLGEIKGVYILCSYERSVLKCVNMQFNAIISLNTPCNYNLFCIIFLSYFSSSDILFGKKGF